MTPKYSVIIPTRNGIKYLPFAIASVLKQQAKNFELIVSDNYSTDGTLEYLKSIKDDRIRIVQPDRPLSMVKHFEFMLTQPRGEWISVLGDDDGLQLYFFELCEILTECFSTYEVIASKRAYFFWPGCENIYGNKVLEYEAANSFDKKNSSHQLWKLLVSDANYFEEPQFYTGTLFRSSLIERIKLKQAGTLFNSIIPDAVSVAMILKFTDSYIFSSIPLSWVGSSPKSTGFSSSNNHDSEKSVLKSKDDFLKLNAIDAIASHPKFPDVMAIFDVQYFFLEALAQSNLLYQTLFLKILDFYPIRYFVFLKLYKNYLVNPARKELDLYYRKVFLSHGLSISILKFLYYSKVVAVRIVDRIGMLFPKRKQKLESLILISDNHTDYPSINEAGIASLRLYKNLKIRVE